MPTNALELLELSAVRRGLSDGLVEQRKPPMAPSMCCCNTSPAWPAGRGWTGDGYASIRRAAAYADLSRDDWDWCLKFLEHGGDCLGAYPRYRKLEWDGDSERFRVRENAIARLHRLNIGTITAAPAITVRFVRGPSSAMWRRPSLASSNPKTSSFFRRQLEFVRLRDMTAYVKLSTRKSRTVPAWAGARWPSRTC